MINMVCLAEEYIAGFDSKQFSPVRLPGATAPVGDVAAILRGSCAVSEGSTPRRMVTEFRTSPAIMNYVNGTEAGDYATRGVTTPDLVIRVKQKPLIVPPPEAGRLEKFKQAVIDGINDYVADYTRYFEENNGLVDNIKVMIDPIPRLVLVPGMGMFALGRSKKAARVAADVGENIIATVSDAEAIGSFDPLPDKDLFDLEYWSLEQAKLGKADEAPLAGQVVVITGGGGTIGRATAGLMSENGAHVAVLDRIGDDAAEVAGEIGNDAIGIACDVTAPGEVEAAFAQICEEYGGIDILVSNAGAAWEGEIGTMPDETLRQSFELNFFAHQQVAQHAVRIMLQQGMGGVLLFNTSKQAVNPGANFGAYGLPKAATLLLSRQYALEYGRYGIRSNAVNADRIRGGLLTDDMIASRAEARGMEEGDYMAGNLLHREVGAEHVAKAFLDLALAERTTAGVTTVDGGNIAAALR
jgi:NAD(P)-dependent dehydrogenase (short-subunit alcohol dehydrogenase family)